MSTAGVRRDFDVLAAVYDETRSPLDPEATQNLLGFLQEHRFRSVLEVGVGTGRISQPLRAGGIRVVGVDASRGMLAQAAKKELPHLVRGTAYHLPFPDRAFDVCLFAHVLHILDDVTAALAEAARVSRSGVLSIMDPAPEVSPGGPPPEPTPREVVRRVLTEAGYPDLLGAGPRVKERAILRDHPPRETRTLSDRRVTEPLSKPLDTLEKRAYRQVLDVPSEVLERAVRIARERVGDRTIAYSRREELVWWVDG